VTVKGGESDAGASVFRLGLKYLVPAKGSDGGASVPEILDASPSKCTRLIILQMAEPTLYQPESHR
jgi:hypothetical protein